MGQPSKLTSTPWYVYVAESTNGGKTFTQSRATNVIHRGELCTHGSGCADKNSRNLLDFRYHVTSAWHKWLCRRSDKARISWARFRQLEQRFRRRQVRIT